MTFRQVLFVLFASALLVLGFLPSLSIQTAAFGAWPAPGDFAANFDNFASGVVSPFPWSSFTSNSTCFTSRSTVSGNSPLSPPNTYGFVVNGGSCSSGYNATLRSVFNATGSYATVSYWFKPTGNGSNYAANNLLMYLCLNPSNSSSCSATPPKLEFSQDVSTAVPTVNGWTKLSGSVPVTPGSVFTVVIMPFIGVAGGGAISGYMNVDNISIIYGSPIISGYNFAMYNNTSPTLSWFDPTAYVGSALLLNYSSGAFNSSASGWSNPLSPTGGLNLADVKYANFAFPTARLITLYLGNVYSRSLIPSPSGKLNMYIDNPTSVQAYKVSVFAPIGFYGSGSMIFIASGGHNITSGYLDSTSSYSTYLVPGVYSVTLNDGVHTFTEAVSFPSTTSAVSIDAYSYNVPITANGISSLRWSAMWNSSNTGILFGYQDNTSSTSAIGVQIKLLNGSGTFLVFSQIYAVATPSFVVSIPANSTNLNYGLGQFLTVSTSITSSYYGANFSLGSQPLGGCTRYCFLKAIPNLPSDVGALDLAFPYFSWANGFAMLVILFTGGGFGLFQAKIGAIITPIVAGFFVLAGFLPIDSTVLTTLIALALLGALSVWRRNP